MIYEVDRELMNGRTAKIFGASRSIVIALLTVWGLAYRAMPVALQMWMAKAAPDVREGGMALFVANFQISIAIGSLAGGL